MAKFSMLAFDGLKKRRSTKRKASRRPKASKAMVQVCGCKVEYTKRRGGGKQPTLKCVGSPMRRFIKRSDVAKYRNGGCTKMPKAIR
jgi:hypothetical protein